MGDIPEHHSEQKGESNRCEDSGVDLAVSGDAVGLHDLLAWVGEGVDLELRGRLLRFELVEDRRRGHLGYLAQLGDLGGGNVQSCCHELVSHLHLVEAFVKDLLFGKEDAPLLQHANGAYSGHEIMGLLIDHPDEFPAALVFLDEQPLVPLEIIFGVGQRNQGRTQRLNNSLELLLECIFLGGGEEHEYHIVVEPLQHGQPQTSRLDDAHSGISSGHSEDHFGDSRHLLGLDESGQVGQAGHTPRVHLPRDAVGEIVVPQDPLGRGVDRDAASTRVEPRVESVGPLGQFQEGAPLPVDLVLDLVQALIGVGLFGLKLVLPLAHQVINEPRVDLRDVLLEAHVLRLHEGDDRRQLLQGLLAALDLGREGAVVGVGDVVQVHQLDFAEVVDDLPADLPRDNQLVVGHRLRAECHL